MRFVTLTHTLIACLCPTIPAYDCKFESNIAVVRCVYEFNIVSGGTSVLRRGIARAVQRFSATTGKPDACCMYLNLHVTADISELEPCSRCRNEPTFSNDSYGGEQELTNWNNRPPFFSH